MEDSLEYARALDDADELKDFRNKFHIPYLDERPCIYFCGNSLGLQPQMAEEFLQTELDDWKNLGVEGHLHATNPWVSYHQMLKPALAEICGAEAFEVVAMNGLTVNLHLLLASFYRPHKRRFKIIAEANAFSSDLYALQSQVELHGFTADESIITIEPFDGFLLSEDDIIKAIEKHSDDLALVFLGGVNYQSGQVLDMKRIAAAAHKAGAVAGFDLAHAIGNINLELNSWDIDFAAWCSYKYLNSGPGGTAGIFINRKHLDDPKITPAFRGWWGHREEDRFLMKPDFIPAKGVDAWQLSNAPVLSMAVQRASLQLFQDAGMDRLTQKSRRLTDYLDFLLKSMDNEEACFRFRILTPKARGCQISIKVENGCEELFQLMNREGIMCDMRRPDIIRLAPVPLYNTFTEVYLVAQFLKKYCTYDK